MERSIGPSAGPPSPGSPLFPIVGLGASAGGLEALEAFLNHVPPECGMAFVVVQHQDPTHKGMLVELLQRSTPMAVTLVTEGRVVQPGQVYVIPPNRDLSLLRGRLHLLEPAAPRGLRLPIDFFFRSLAQDCGERAVGVVLSGMGSDGTLGLRAIREAAGLGLAQTPATARFDGMPRSAIQADLADGVAAPEELPARILGAIHRTAAGETGGYRPDKDAGALDPVLVLLRARTGQDFSQYKRPTVQRRIHRRMAIHQIRRLQDYVRYLRENPVELDLLFQELLIGVTHFFRDPEAWGRLGEEALPGMLAECPRGSLRAWVPGCSTGEEAYSLAMVFREALARDSRPCALTIFATDLDRNAIDRARTGLYPPNIHGDVSQERLGRFFHPEDGAYRVSPEIREMIIFAPQNLAMDPPFTNLDLVTCRNLLIYLDPVLQRRLVGLFHYSLRPGGLLFLGAAETVGSASELFAPVDRKHRIYRRLEHYPSLETLDFPSRPTSRTPEASMSDPSPARGATSPPNLQTLTEQLLLQRFVPSAVLVDPGGEILFTSGRTGKYLEPAVGKANLNIFAMARRGLGEDLDGAFRRATREQKPVYLHNVKVDTNGESQHVDVSVEPLLEEPLKGRVMIIFSDAPADGALPAPLTPEELRSGIPQADLKSLQAELRTTREEMSTSQEELKSTNEELQSTNEELQSTNEELTTSKEEMQSMNEELQTVNHELQAKVDELSSVNSDLKNLLNSTDIATLFLDDRFRIRRFTTQAAAIFRLMPGDTGRPITDITTILDYPDLPGDVELVLETLLFKERRVATRDQRWFNVRIMPYRTLENRIDGVVLTFAEVTLVRALEEALREAQEENRRLREAP